MKLLSILTKEQEQSSETCQNVKNKANSGQKGSLKSVESTEYSGFPSNCCDIWNGTSLGLCRRLLKHIKKIDTTFVFALKQHLLVVS